MSRRILLDFSLVASGGSFTYATGFLNSLPEAWARVRPSHVDLAVVLPGSMEMFPKEEDGLCAVGVAVHRIPYHSPGTWRTRIIAQVAVPLLSRKLRATDVFIPRDIPPLLLSGRVTILIRNLLVWQRPKGVRDAFTLRLMRLAGTVGIHRATSVLAVTAAIARELPLIPSQSRGVVFHGCDLRALTAGDKDGTFLSGHSLLQIATLGSITPHKRLELAVDLSAALKRRGLPSHLSIWGPADDVKEVERLRKVGLDRLGYDPVRGPIALQHRSDVFRSADILVMGSSIESFGFAMVEAMRSSTVVLAPHSPLVEEICGDCALTYEEGSSESAASALVEALPRLPVLAASGLDRSLRLFTWSRCVESTLTALLDSGTE